MQNIQFFFKYNIRWPFNDHQSIPPDDWLVIWMCDNKIIGSLAIKSILQGWIPSASNLKGNRESE